MSEIEKYIKENRDSFDGEEPTEGHTERFLKKLEKAEKKQKTSHITFWRVAAAVIVLVAVSLSVLIPKFNHVDDAQYASLSLGDVSTELADVEFYYQSKLEKESSKLAALAEQDSTVKSYFEEIEQLKAEYRQLQIELYSSNAHDKVIEAMIQNFRIRLSILEGLEKRKKTLNDEAEELSYSISGEKAIYPEFVEPINLIKNNLKYHTSALRRTTGVCNPTKHNKLNILIS